jgi:A/G-specific adenine glycosylase
MMITPQTEVWFRRNLIEWFAENPRPLPWKGEKNPYLVWISEIILQQTRVGQGLPYFERFRAAYPTVEALANAPEADVMKLWEGLGYYARARNLHATAKQIAGELGGNFPKTHDEILKLKGVGSYTAAAIASFAYDLPFAVVDGNVFRVLSRIFGIETPIDSTDGKKIFAKLAQDLLDFENPAQHNQAMMDFGATHCKPVAPLCDNCPFQSDCKAFLLQKTEKLPVKSKKLEKKTRYFYFFVFKNKENSLVRERTERDIWQQLFEFPLLETQMPIENWENLQHFLKENQLTEKWLDETAKMVADTGGGAFSGEFRQQLTHQTIVARFVELNVADSLFLQLSTHFQTQPIRDLKKLAFPRIINTFFEGSIWNFIFSK